MIYLHASGVDIIRNLLLYFGKQSYTELRGLLPQFEEPYFNKSLEILISKYEITLSEEDNQKWYQINPNNKRIYNPNPAPERTKYKPALDFIRLMINSKDKDNNYINKISCIVKGDFPVTLYFEMNGKVYEVIYMPTKDISMLCNLIIAQDKKSDTDSFNRIIITDNSDDFSLIAINVKMKICFNSDGSFTAQKGEE